MAISSIGVGSGLPLGELLDQLRTAENQSLALIQSRQKTVESRLSAYGTLKGTIEALKKASDALGKAEAFGALKASVSGDAFTATASAKGIAGEYNISVNQLAATQTMVAAGQADRTTAIATGSGTVDIEIALAGGGTKTLTMDEADTSLNGIVKAINADPELGIKATLVNDGSGAPHRLLLTASASGTDAAVASITVEGSNELQAAIGYNSTNSGGATGGLTQQQAAANAQLTINGIAVTSQSNHVTDAIEGVELTLSKVTTEPATLSLVNDDTVTADAINAFVTAYNKLQTTIKSLTAFNVEAGTQSALTGDSLARNVQSQIRGALNVAESSGAIANLSQMGITTNPNDGLLVVDSTKLNNALKDNMVDVQKLFTGENGLSARLGAAADSYIKTGGVISNATDSINRTIKDLQKQYDATSDRIDMKMENYRKQFAQLDVMMSQMNSISTYLTQQLSMLGSSSDK